MTTITYNGAVSLSERELDLLDRYLHAANCLSVGQIYLPDIALLSEPLVQREMVEGVDDAGLDARGDTCEADPVKAVEDVLVTFPAERIVLFTRLVAEHCCDGGIDADALRQRFGLPVEQVE
jgi:hypothetical protein